MFESDLLIRMNAADQLFQKWPQQCFQSHSFFQNIATPHQEAESPPPHLELDRTLWLPQWIIWTEAMLHDFWGEVGKGNITFAWYSLSLSGWSPLGGATVLWGNPSGPHGETEWGGLWEEELRPPAKSHNQPPDMLEWMSFSRILTLSPWVFQVRPQKLGNKFKLALLCPIQIPTPWIYEHNKWLFKLLSLRVICYTAIATRVKGNQGCVGWGWHFSQTSDSAQMNVNTALCFCPSKPQR